MSQSLIVIIGSLLKCEPLEEKLRATLIGVEVKVYSYRDLFMSPPTMVPTQRKLGEATTVIGWVSEDWFPHSGGHTWRKIAESATCPLILVCAEDDQAECLKVSERVVLKLSSSSDPAITISDVYGIYQHVKQ